MLKQINIKNTKNDIKNDTNNDINCDTVNEIKNGIKNKINDKNKIIKTSIQNVPSEVTKLCNQYLKSEFGYNYRLAKKFIILQKAFDKLNIPKEDILTSNPKGIYFGFVFADSKNYLRNKIQNNTNFSCDNLKTSSEIFNWWIDRWATNRFNNLTKTNRLNKTEALE